MSYLAASVDSITNYNGFSSRRSREVDRVYLTFFYLRLLSYLTIISLIYISVLQAEYSLTEVLK